MPQSILLPTTFLPLQSVQLGRLVLDVQDPQSDYFNPADLIPRDAIVRRQEKFHGLEDNTTGDGFGASLAHFLSVSHSKQKGNAVRINSEQMTTYLLNNNGQWFRNVVKDENTRKWIEERNKSGDDVYLISGFHTVFNAVVVESDTQKTSISGEVAVPIAETLTASGIPVIPFGKVIDPSFNVSRDRGHTDTLQFTAPGEQPLGPNTWKTYSTFRGQTTGDVVEIDLQDDLELDDEDGEIETVTIDGETFSTLNNVSDE